MDWSTVYKRFSKRKEFKDFTEDSPSQSSESSSTELAISECSILEESNFYQRTQIFYLCGHLLKSSPSSLLLLAILLIPLEEE